MPNGSAAHTIRRRDPMGHHRSSLTSFHGPGVCSLIASALERIYRSAKLPRGQVLQVRHSEPVEQLDAPAGAYALLGDLRFKVGAVGPSVMRSAPGPTVLPRFPSSSRFITHCTPQTFTSR